MRKAEDHTVNEDGLFVPLFENYETDGGRPTSRVSNKKYLSIGEVIATTWSELKPGDVVTVIRSCVNDQYFFPLDRSKLVQDFDGTILVPNSMIECKVQHGN